jgi:uncharacterized protein (TIGR03067 family)
MRALCLVMMLAAGPVAADEPAAARDDLKRLEGAWEAESVERDGRPEPPAAVSERRLRVEAGRWALPQGPGGAVVAWSRVAVDPGASPKAITLTAESSKGQRVVSEGVYELDGDTLRVCFPTKRGGPRPAKVEAKAGVVLEVWKREKK